MCGIAGIISSDATVINQPVLHRMADALAHRGPDGEGFWINDANNAGFGHRRLSILDLTAAAAQPMHYLNRYTIVYNGEIYNYLELKKNLLRAGYEFRSYSDTEVILAAYDYYKEKCVQFFDGMFSFAIWDEVRQKLFAARDRFGEKPFYYFINEDSFYFGSEMKALWAAGIEKTVDEKMLLNYITLGYVQSTSDKSVTFFKKIRSLKPSSYLEYNAATKECTITQYWELNKQVVQKYSEAQALYKFNQLFSTSIHRRLRSDVPVGSSLSGGLDSSSICYYILKELEMRNTPELSTFSAVFPGFEKDESAYINEMKQRFEIKNYQVTPDADSLIDDFETIAYFQEEPFPSSSIYAQYKVFELAKKHGVKVLLDGQGADEILGGYEKYIHWYIQEMVSRSNFIGAKREIAMFSKNGIRPQWGIKNILAAYLPSHVAIALEKKEYNKVINNQDISHSLLKNLKGREWEGIHKPIVTKLNDILYFNTTNIGMEELLRYADRNSMAHSTEVRLPFLNAELVQFIFSLPSSYKIRNGFTKWILRKLTDNKLPKNIVWRTDKTGYEPPQKMWMENSRMKDYMHESKKLLIKHDILKESALNKQSKSLSAHAADNFDWRYLCASKLFTANSL